MLCEIVMDEQALLGLNPLADGTTQQQTLQYFEQLKSSADGWQLCATALTSGTYTSNDHVKFFCFQVVEDFFKKSYPDANTDVTQNVKTFLLTWLQQQSCGPAQDKSFIRNKAAQVFSLAFIIDYPSRWPGFFMDLIQTLQWGPRAVDMYLRILLAIDSEVVDREITHTAMENERNTLIKDTMRVQCVTDLVDSWYQIISNYEDSNTEVTCLCLEVIGAYVSWIDLSLVANDRFVGILLRFMAKPLLRESSCDCIHEIILKGMDPLGKTKLIESFITVLDSAGLLNTLEDNEGDYLSKLGKLINGIGLQLIQCWQKLFKSKELSSADVPLKALEHKVPLMFRFLRHEDDDVSGSVIQFAHDYISLLKQLPCVSEQQKQNVKDLLFIIMQKMKYDESYSFDHEGEDEAMFEEYRKELKIIFNNIGALDSELVLTAVHNLFAQTLTHWQNKQFQDVEIVTTLLYMMAEALPATHSGQYFMGDKTKVSTLQEMMRLLVSSRVSCFQHPAVVMQFFETVVRYDKFFTAEPQYVPDVLMAFLDERGLHNPSAHIRSRTAYLFSRFVRTVNKSLLQDCLEEILCRLSDLLVLNSPDNGLKCHLSGEDQLFIYETAGVFVVQSNFPPEKKIELMRQLLAPIVSKFDILLQQMLSESDDTKQMAYAQCLSQAMAFASRVSKGFSSNLTMKQCGLIEPFTEILKIFLHALDVPVHRSLLQMGVRQYLHRMVVCMQDEILPYIPMAMENLLKNPDAKELHDFIPLINQLVMKFKKQIAPFLQESFMPIVRTIFHVLSLPCDTRDQVAANERKLLQRGYFSFIATVVNNNVTEVLQNQDPANLSRVLMTVIEGAVEIPDPQTQKLCFSILKRLVEVWGGSNVLSGFDDVTYKQIVPACFMAPMKTSFDLADGQTILVLNECAACLKAVSDKKGDDFYQISPVYIPTNLKSKPRDYTDLLSNDEVRFKNLQELLQGILHSGSFMTLGRLRYTWICVRIF
ncbi:hypothetical protein LSH36_487g04031 [Paralvinella palmiformis]|uniref:Exportin-T n=1 Tax=Paralvinella palmiformis TaxID=53620 RepID=A0AAD9MZG3_9ANNE|nr:hypothetical protein LSH36_487g04031 [Paralvinella palmiformis]